MLIIIIGLPASGKTTYFNENKLLKEKYSFYDDFIFSFIDGELIEEIKNNNNVCITDPRLCNFEIFQNIIKIIKEYIDESNIKLILFKNNKEQCLINSKNRIKKDVEQTIHNYSSIYDINNYKNYNCEFIDVYSSNI